MKDRGKYSFGFRNAYHGMSPYTSGLCGVGGYRHHIPGGFGIQHVSPKTELFFFFLLCSGVPLVQICLPECCFDYADGTCSDSPLR